jgi:hypothetical protein
MMPESHIKNTALKASGINAISMAAAALLAGGFAMPRSSLPSAPMQPSSTVVQLKDSGRVRIRTRHLRSPHTADHSSHERKKKPTSQPSGTEQPPDPPIGAPTDPSDTSYPYIVYMDDHRIIKCDVQEDGDYYNLVKKAGTIRVAKTDVEKIQRSDDPATTQPSGSDDPTTQPAS